MKRTTINNEKNKNKNTITITLIITRTRTTATEIKTNLPTEGRYLCFDISINYVFRNLFVKNNTN